MSRARGLGCDREGIVDFLPMGKKTSFFFVCFFFWGGDELGLDWVKSFW